MARNEKCSEIQIIIHGIIVFVVGVLIGTSLVASSESAEITLVNNAQDLESRFISEASTYEKSLEKFLAGEELLEKNTYENYNVQCQKLTSYFIDHPDVNGLKIDFPTKFHTEPMLFLSVNAFEYQPSIVPEKGVRQTLSFLVMNVSKEGFHLKIKVDGKVDVPKKQLSAVSICYVAFVQFKNGEF